MKRIFLFLMTNLAILVVISITLRLLGVDRIMNQSGGLNFNALLIMSMVMGFAGSIISLLMSKWMAKRSVGAHVIETPANATEQWLVNTVKRQAEQAGIGMPEVAIYDAPEINAFATGWNRNNALVAVSTGLMNNMSADEAIVYNFCTALLATGSVPDAQYQPALDRFGERGVMDLVGAVGYYSLVSMVLNVADVQLPPGEPKPLKPLCRPWTANSVAPPTLCACTCVKWARWNC